MDDRYLQLRDDHEPGEPLAEIGLRVPRLAMKDGQPVQLDEAVVLKPLEEGARITKTNDPAVFEAVFSTGIFEEIDPPSKADVTKSVKSTEAARAAAKNPAPEPPEEA